MLKVNGKDATIRSTEFQFCEYFINGEKYGYIPFILVKFKLQEKNGYFYFNLNKTKEQSITDYIGKEYSCVPLDNDDEINYLEIFDTKHLYEECKFNNKMKVNIEGFENEKIKFKIGIKERDVSIEFDDYIGIRKN